MKPTLLIILAFSVLVGCAKQDPAQMTPQDQEAAKAEIREIANHILSATSKMDVDALLKPYWNSPEFALLTAQGSMVDYQTAKNGSAELFKSLTALTYTTVKDEFRFLSGNTVLYTWLGKCEWTFKTGEQAKIDSYAISFVFKKIENSWKIIYAHESASPPTE
jgi:ketosteroid isomerase-like protein